MAGFIHRVCVITRFTIAGQTVSARQRWNFLSIGRTGLDVCCAEFCVDHVDVIFGMYSVCRVGEH